MSIDTRLEDFDRLIQQAMKTWKVPGAAIGIVERGRIIHARGYGLRDVRRDLPATQHTRFGIGSCTKAFTAAAIAMLVDEGRLAWDAPVRHYLPSFQLCDPVAGERATVRDLLTHRTGLPAHNFAWVAADATRLEMVGRLRHLQPSAEFRAGYQYNNLMYMVAGALVEHIKSQTWEQFLAERIFQPLGMMDTFCFHRGMGNTADLAAGYETVGQQIRPWSCGASTDIFRYEGPGGPAGAICSNVIDMCKWLSFQMSEGRIGRRILISRPNLREMHTPQVVGGEAIPAAVAGTDLLDASYGMGWAIQPYRGHRMLYHSGLVAGYNAVTSFLPAESLGIVVLTNIRGSAVWPVAMLGAYDRLLGLKPIPWLGRMKRYFRNRLAEQRKQSRQRSKLRSSRPPRPLADYVGTYCHPGYGSVDIRLVAGRLRVRFRVLNWDLQHRHDHAWDMVGRDDRWNVSFGQGRTGRIASITIPFEPSVPCTFNRSGGSGRRKAVVT